MDQPAEDLAASIPAPARTASNASVNPGVVTPVMVGRSAQMAALRDIFGQVSEGSPAVVLVGGEAGAGKTRLIAEFAASVAGRAVVLRGGCVELGGAGLAFAPFTAALRVAGWARGS